MNCLPIVATALALATSSLLPCQAPGQGGIPECAEMKKTDSGLEWGVLEKGPGGASPQDGDMVEVHYTGWLTDGKKFDSSRDRGAPSKFGVTDVIAGWTEGLKLMTPGMRCKFVIPGDLAYGEQGRPGRIPPNATLVFDVELLRVIPLPEFRKANAEAQKKLDNGIAVEVLEAGTGAQVDPKKGATVRFAIWRPDGSMLACSEKLDGDKVSGLVGQLGSMRLGPLPFVDELVKSSKVGDVLRAEVPQAVWGRAGGDTVWELELESVNEVPTFRALDRAEVATTQSGLKYEAIALGEGTAPTAAQTVRAHYTGWLTDGTMFDSSHARGEPTEFPLNRVIPGWTEGVQLMKPGGKFLFEIPAELGYGARAQGKIPANSTLIFLVELVEVK